MNQHAEDLWLDADEGAVSMQLTPVTVDFAVSEYEGHTPASRNLRTFSGKPPAFAQDRSRPAAALWRPWPRIRNPHVETCSGPPDVAPVSSHDERAFGDADGKSKVFVLVTLPGTARGSGSESPLLRQRGHLVFTPTLTGLGERSHLARAEVGLDVHVTDVVNVLKHEDLRDVILVGHSSSGAVITGVADRAPTHIALVVYLDAFVPEDGQAVLDLITPERRDDGGIGEDRRQRWLLPRFAPPPWETIVRDMWGVTDEDDVRWMLDRLGPTPPDI